MFIPGEPEPESPRIKALVALDLTDASHGNGLGVGLADFTTQRLVNKINFPIMAKNVFTSGFLERGKIPLTYENDEAAIEAAIDHVFRANPDDRDNARIIRIRSTLDLEDVQVSSNLLPEIQNNPDFISATPPQNLNFMNGVLF
jgi:hypothetical protein